MAKEKNLDYERVDEKTDKYRRILVKFNPHFLGGSDFEIEFIPILESYGVGRVFVSEIDLVSTIDLYRWASRRICLVDGLGKYKCGTIIPKNVNMAQAEIGMERHRIGDLKLEPRHIISLVKRVFEGVTGIFNEPTAYTYSYFLYSGQLGSLPVYNEDFTVKRLKKSIEEFPYRCRNANGEMVERTLVEHLFDTHKTEYIENTILNFLGATCSAAGEIVANEGKEQ